jgi:hypothetical protein
MNKTSAQEIRRLETRIAHLEREAGIFQQIKNIPKTFINKLKMIGSDVSSYFKISPSDARKKEELVKTALRDNLQARLDLAFGSNIVFDDPLFVLSVGDYNTSAPELTEVSVGGHEMALRDVPSFLIKLGHSRASKDVKGAYVSWHKDFKDTIRILKDGQISEKDKVTFLQKIKRFSKLLYRVVKTLMDFNYTYYFFEKLISFSTIAASLVLNPLGVAIVAMSVFKPFIFSRLGKGLLNIIEGSLRRDNSNIKEFDQLAFGKQASLYPHTARFARQLEQYC